MVDNCKTYEEQKKDIYSKKEYLKKVHPQTSSYDEYEYDESLWEGEKVGLTDIMQVGTKVLIGGGLGLLGGVATIVFAAAAAEVVLAGVVTKIAGVVGGAAGLSLGLHEIKKKRNKE